MNRPSHLWCVFTACVLLAATALGWITRHSLRLEKERLAATENADRQERLRLAMWRVELAASGLVLRETSRPPEEFRAYRAVRNPITQTLSQEKVPSTLIKDTPAGVLLHFEMDAAGNLTSPQSPEGSDWARVNDAVHESEVAPARKILSKLRTLLAKPTSTVLRARCVALSRDNSSSLPPPSNNGMAISTITQCILDQDPNQNASAPINLGTADNKNYRSQQAQETQQSYNLWEFSNRASIVAGNNSFTNNGTLAKPTAVPQTQSTTAFSGHWIEEQLVLTRLASYTNGALTQGIWLDWPKLKMTWEALFKDILPNGTLEPIPLDDTTKRESIYLHLASLPVRLNPGTLTLVNPDSSNPLRSTLLASWIAAAVAAAALAFLLMRTISLSERRAAFVSAVTHELRTPLTTFRLYTEMLAQEMIPDPTTRRAYLETLHHEAGRLNHLVENVLSFARLERGSARSRVEEQTIQTHLERVLPRLAQRAQEGRLQLQLEIPASIGETRWSVDVTSLEQILLNLTDNAVKYAPGATSQDTAHTPLGLQATLQGKRVQLRLRDHGPGICPKAAKRIFLPFHKSAAEAAHTAPGVGLGLSLSRRLAKQMGGDLWFEPAPGGGAVFVLELPVRATGQSARSSE